MNVPPIPGVRKVAVLRANAVGDFVMALPALEALRHAYPGAEIVLLGAPWHVDFLRHRPGPVDRAIALPPIPGITVSEDSARSRHVSDRFLAEMREERFDLAVQMHGGGKNSNPFIRALRARITIGSRAHDAPPLDHSIPYVYFQHETMRCLEIVSLAGAKTFSLEPSLTPTGADLSEAESVLPPSDLPLAVLHPGAQDPRRRWPPRDFAAVGDALVRAGARVAVTGTAGEREVVNAVLTGMREIAIDLCDRLSLGGLTGLLSRAAVVVANDTGPRHVAAAVGAPTTSIYWCFNMVNAGPLTRLRHRPHVSWRLTCPVCGLLNTATRCPHDVSFVADVPADEVVASALALLRGE
jgi:ADP-heptose:LPS heptosyltransferase